MSRSAIFCHYRSCAIFIILLYCLLLGELYAQKAYSSQDILQEGIRLMESDQSAIPSMKLPSKQLIDKMEFRTEFNELDLQQQEYTFRLSFKNDKLRQQQNKLYKMQLDQLSRESELNQDDQAELYYEQLITWYFIQKKEPLYQQKSRLISDKNKLEMALFLDDKTLNFNDVLKVNDRLLDIQLQLYELDNDKLGVFEALGIQDTTALLSDNNWISIDRLQSVINQQNSTLDSHPELGLQADRIALLNQEYIVEENDINSIFDFAQLRYKADDKLPIEREISLGVSFFLPYKRVNQANLTEIEIEKIEELIQQNEIETRLQKDLLSESTRLKELLRKYDFLNSIVEKENLPLLKEEYLTSDQVSPIPLINLELMILNRRLELLDIEEDIYRQYIEALQSIDALRFNNNINYLDEVLTPIE